MILTADHGGHGRNHQSDDPLDIEIPWLIWGSGIAQGRVIDCVSTVDTASTVREVLGIPAIDSMQGEAVNWTP